MGVDASRKKDLVLVPPKLGTPQMVTVCLLIYRGAPGPACKTIALSAIVRKQHVTTPRGGTVLTDSLPWFFLPVGAAHDTWLDLAWAMEDMNPPGPV